MVMTSCKSDAVDFIKHQHAFLPLTIIKYLIQVLGRFSEVRIDQAGKIKVSIRQPELKSNVPGKFRLSGPGDSV